MFINYKGLSGAIKTGCQLSPGYQSKFCNHHSPRVACTSTNDSQTSTSREGIVGLITNKKQTRNGTFYEVYTCMHANIIGEGIVYCYSNYTQLHHVHVSIMYVCMLEFIDDIMYMCFQVAWLESKAKVTWECASSLPQSLVDEFEANVVSNVDILTNASFGVINHTVVISKADPANPPPPKLAKYTPPAADPGCVIY